MTPNLFAIATGELSQDGFFTWLLQWADDSHRFHNEALNETAKDFIRLLLGKPSDYAIHNVKAGRQWNSIDIWAEIDDEYFIVIEDKTNTGEHSKQLERYKQIAEDHQKTKNYKLVLVYLKTGNESLSTLKTITEKGYSTIGRKSVLEVLNRRPFTSEILGNFVHYLSAIEQQTSSYVKFENVTSEWKAAEGFYVKLQESIAEWTDWRYVSTPTGGFLGFWYYWQGTKEIEEIYIQIENSFEFGGIRLVIKIGSWEKSTQTLYRLLGAITPFAINNGLSIVKPDKFRAGETSTLAIVKDAFKVDSIGGLDLDLFLKTLRQLEKTLDDYCEHKSQSELVSGVQATIDSQPSS